MSNKTEEEYVEAIRPILSELCHLLTTAVQDGITLNFNINIDQNTKVASVTNISTAKSHLP